MVAKSKSRTTWEAMVETIGLLAFAESDQKPGVLRWCEMDFATIHSITRLVAVGKP